MKIKFEERASKNFKKITKTELGKKK